MHCFEYITHYRVDIPHHSHRRVVSSHVVEYKTLHVPEFKHMFDEFKQLLIDACSRLDGQRSDYMKISLQTEAEKPIEIHSYYYQRDEVEFIQEIEKFSSRVYRVCQSKRCFEIGNSIHVLIDRIKSNNEAGSSCARNSYTEFNCINQLPSLSDVTNQQENSIRLPGKSSLVSVKLLTFASTDNCLFICLFAEIIRFRRNEYWANTFDPLHPGGMGQFPFGCSRRNMTKWINEIREGKLTNIISKLQLAGKAFARVLGLDHLIDKPLDTGHFVEVVQKLTFCGLKFVLYDRAMNCIASSDNQSTKCVNLMIFDGHYHIILNLKSEGSSLCRHCLSFFKKRTFHDCQKICHLCKTSRCFELGLDTSEHKCQKCRIVFRNQHCSSLHLCPTSKKCKYCKQRLLNHTGVEHICKYFCCRICGATDECLDHMCSLTGASRASRLEKYRTTPRLQQNQPLSFDMDSEEKRITEGEKLIPMPPFKSKGPTILIYYDIETARLPAAETDAYCPADSVCDVLVPVVVCAQTECEGCVRGKPSCECKQKRWTFQSTRSTSCMKMFVHALMSYVNSSQLYHYKLIAHNGGRFDHHFLLREIANHAPSPDLFIRRGSSIIGMKLKNMTVLDSFQFISMSLRAMPKAIGADIAPSKDFFPHKLTSWDALEKGLPCLPPKKDFDYSKMNTSDKSEFDLWYSQQPTSHYDFASVMKEYCMKDVEVLRLCCRKFISNWSLRFGFNPFDCFTLPSTVTQSMIVKTELAPLIPLTPYHGYNRGKTESRVARAYITFLGRKMGVNFKIGEKLSPKFHPDGFTDHPRKIAVDFHGCYYHLCDECGFNTYRENFTTKGTYKMPDGEVKTFNEPVTKEVEEHKRLMKQRFCLEHGIEYIEVWEHELKKLSPEDTLAFNLIYNELETLFEPDDLKHRDALFGGRTEVFKMFHECADDETIEYHDVNGLYPHVLMDGCFPLMDPTFHTRIRDTKAFLRELDADPLVKKAALCRAIVTPPRDLLLPVLPAKVNGKLKFGLCTECMAECLSVCTHSDLQRKIRGTWTSFELNLALENGYEIDFIERAEVYELCAGPNSPGLPNPHREFVGRCMAAKDYAERTGNKSARYLAKLAANTYWGAMGKKADNLSTKFFSTVPEFYKFLTTESVRIKEIYSVGSLLKLKYNTMNEMVETPRRTSLITAIFVTSQARIKLYNYMKMLGPGRVIYTDTDSVIWLKKKTDVVPFVVGSQCGQMSNEIDKDYPGCFIKRFVSLGPKSYAYEVYDSNGFKCSAMRMKGISFRGSTREEDALTFDKMKKLLMHELDQISVRQFRFVISEKHHTLHPKEMDKKVQLTMDKRHVNTEDYTTTPFGICERNKSKRRRLM